MTSKYVLYPKHVRSEAGVGNKHHDTNIANKDGARLQNNRNPLPVTVSNKED